MQNNKCVVIAKVKRKNTCLRSSLLIEVHYRVTILSYSNFSPDFELRVACPESQQKPVGTRQQNVPVYTKHHQAVPVTAVK